METSIYGLCDPRSGELRYIGKTAKSVEKRRIRHVSDARLGKSGYKNNWIRQLLALDLEPEVFVVETVIGNGDDEEIYHIAQFRSIGCNLTNVTNGGEGKPGWVAGPETRAKIGAVHRGKIVSAETRERQRRAHLGHVRSPEAKAKFLKTLALRTPEQKAETAAKMSASMMGHKTSDETKAKIRAGNLGKPKSAETRARMSASAKNRKRSTS